MTLEQYGAKRLKVRDDPGSLIDWIGIALAAIAVAAVVFAKSFVAGLVLGFATVGLWLALRYADVAVETTFNKASGRFRLRQRSLGKAQHTWEGRLDEIENIVVEASARYQDGDEGLALRPVLVVGGQALPLTFGRYARGDKARRIALRLRSFLGLPQHDLIEDSIRMAARDPWRTKPAVRLARLGKGMEPDAAAAYIEQLKAEYGENPQEPAS